MGGGYAPSETPRTIIVERTPPVHEDLVVIRGALCFEDGRKVPVLVAPGCIRVGCHRLTFEAWTKLKELIEGK